MFTKKTNKLLKYVTEKTKLIPKYKKGIPCIRHCELEFFENILNKKVKHEEKVSYIRQNSPIKI